jgi:uncharacterized protein YkwD
MLEGIMRTKSQIATTYKGIAALFILFGLISFAFPSGESAAKSLIGHDPTYQTPALLYDEAQTVYLGNLERRAQGIPPLRWNLQLTHASRWFSWDSTENRPGGYCGHQDTLGTWPGDRAAYFGYLGFAGWENAFCGYLSPADAIQGWMNSPGHRANLLETAVREIGLGYYRRDSDGRGYVAQGFATDSVYAPIVIEHEALFTTSPNVNLYIYDREPQEGFAGWGAATQMMLSNNSQFSGAAWEPYGPNKAWTLAGGTGWRNVYVKTRDNLNRTQTVSDSIYLGPSAPQNELGPAQMSTTNSKVLLHDLNGGGLPQVQISVGWLADDADGSFAHWWGNGERLNDAAAWGGTAYRLFPGDGESYAWSAGAPIIKDTPQVAYFRLKVNNNTSSSEVARISVQGSVTEYGPLQLRGTDFTAANQYQEFTLSFATNTNPEDESLFFNFWRSGSADLYIDAVSIFSAPQEIASPLIWSVPGGNYRGQGIWIRYTDGTHFTPLMEAPLVETPSPIFGDVPDSYWAWNFIERLYEAGITGGCGTSPLRFCPDDIVTRAQMAVFLLRGIHTSAYVPPAIGPGTGFGDVPSSYWSASWIKQLAAEGITTGCGNGNFCPEHPVTRAQMAVFLLRSKHGASYSPPGVGAGTGFGDVPPDYWAAAWIKQLVTEGITAGCGYGNYCPEQPVTRDQMAVFLVRTFNLP